MGHGMGRKKAASYAALPAVIERGKVIDVQYNWKGRGYDTVAIAAPITMGGEPYYMGVVVEKKLSTDRFYVHEVLITKDGASAFKNSPSTEVGVDTVADAPSVTNLLQRIIDVNREAKLSRKDTNQRIYDTRTAERIAEGR